MALAEDSTQMSEKEAAVRAAFLYRLAFFVNWEDTTFATADSPLRFCVVGDPPSPVAPLLRSHTRERSVGDRPIEVEQHASGTTVEACHLIYLEREASVAAEQTPGKLVVVDSLEGLQRGGTLALLAEEDDGEQKRLGFVSRREHVNRSGVGLNARLLQLVRFQDEAGGP